MHVGVATEKICWDLTTTRFGVQTGVVTIAGSAALESYHWTRHLLVQHAYDAASVFGFTAATKPGVCWYSRILCHQCILHNSCHRNQLLLLQHAHDAAGAFALTAATRPGVFWYSTHMMPPLHFVLQLPLDLTFVGTACS